MEGGEKKEKITVVSWCSWLLLYFMQGEANWYGLISTLPERGMFCICCGAVHFVPVKPHVLPLQFTSKICVLDNFYEKFEIQLFFEDNWSKELSI